MASRRERKEHLKQERLRREQAAAARARRARLLRALAIGIFSLAGLGATVVALAAGGRGSASGPPAPRGPVALGRLDGLSASAAPWPAEYGHLGQRLRILGLPPVSDVIYHVHALLHVYVDSRPVTVPANLGISPDGIAFSSLHTHDTSGLLHMEATRPFAFRLSDVFAVWGVAFGRDRLGGYRAGGSRRLWAYANGHPIRDPLGYVIHPQDDLVVAYGRRGSFPVKP